MRKTPELAAIPVAYCPLSTGWLQHVGVERTAFDERIRSGATDDELVKFISERVSSERKDKGNRYLIGEMGSQLDEQDEKEGHTV